MSAHPFESPTHFRRILLVRTDRLGDVILTLPMLSFLRTSFPDAFLALLLSKYTGEIVEGNKYADELLWYDDGRTPVAFRTMLRTIKERAFNVVILVHPTPRLAWLMFCARIPLRIGTGYRAYSLLLNGRVYEHRKDARRHELEYNLNLLKELGCNVPPRLHEPDYGIEIPAEAERAVKSMLRTRGVSPGKRLVIIHPSSGGSAREWPPEHFGGLAAKLMEEEDVSIVVSGMAGEERRAEEVIRCAGGKPVSLVGALRMKELAALIRSASLFVSNSTGPLHLAVAVGTPVLGFYPQLVPMSARRWGPYSDRSLVLSPDRPSGCTDCSGTGGSPCACMTSISVERAYDAARELLLQPAPRVKGMRSHG